MECRTLGFDLVWENYRAYGTAFPHSGGEDNSLLEIVYRSALINDGAWGGTCRLLCIHSVVVNIWIAETSVRHAGQPHRRGC
jgi:hypothetical protein